MHELYKCIKVLVLTKLSEYGHEISQSHTADQPAERLRCRATTALLSHAFLKKNEGDIVIAFIRLSVMLFPPKPLDEIQPNLVRELLT